MVQNIVLSRNQYYQSGIVFTESILLYSRYCVKNSCFNFYVPCNNFDNNISTVIVKIITKQLYDLK